jgi:long-chain acyl-CoA synthetase
MNNFNNLGELINYQAINFQNKTALNFYENNHLKSFSNQEFLDYVFYFACGLKEIILEKNLENLQASSQQISKKILIYSYQNPIWLIADLGSILAGLITVPIFHNIANDNLIYQINDSQSSFIFTDNLEILSTLKSQNLITIYYHQLSEDPQDKSKFDYSFNDIIFLGKNAVENKKYSLQNLISKIQNTNLASIIYTSGSTAKPKGVEISHENLITQINDSKQFFPLQGDEKVLSFLPLAHIFERMVMLYYISCGVSVYFVDDLKNIGNFFKEYRPNLMTTVPRVLEKLYLKIVNAIENSNFIKKFIAKKALNFALKKDPAIPNNSIFEKIIYHIFDFLIYKKFREILGGKIKMIICGGASLSLDMERFYHNIKINIYCGYGLTETSPVIATNCPKFHKIGTVGKTFPSVKVKLSSDNELLASGKNVMKQYHNLVLETSQSFEGDYFKTGDLANIDDQGFIKIIGRKKELFKTSNGKYVNPILIEQKLNQEIHFLTGSVIIANDRQFVSALLFPDFELIEKTKLKLKFQGSNLEFIQGDLLNNFVKKIIEKINEKLNHWEQIQKFKIIDQLISIETGEITPSMKLKRNIIEQKFSTIIDNFYK